MGSFGVVIGLTLLICMVVPSVATSYFVGDAQGWGIGVDYSTWTAGKAFKVGDSLVFSYGFNHSVAEVSADNYVSCRITDPMSYDNSGYTEIDLKTSGSHYFISEDIDCSSGMRLAVYAQNTEGGSLFEAAAI
ncbi:hypothetical protein ACFE04_015652 [Oxalis oulophora]